MQDFHNLMVWQKAHALTLLIYRLTVNFPKEELFGLRTQLRKTSVDVAALIAEGCSKPSDDDFAKCVGTALGYANRLEYFALVAHDLKMLSPATYSEMNDAIVEVEKMLSSLWQKLRTSGRNSIDN